MRVQNRDGPNGVAWLITFSTENGVRAFVFPAPPDRGRNQPALPNPFLAQPHEDHVIDPFREDPLPQVPDDLIFWDLNFQDTDFYQHPDTDAHDFDLF